MRSRSAPHRLRSPPRPAAAARPRTDARRRAPPRGARRRPTRRSPPSHRRRAAAPARCTRACPGTSPTAVSVSASSNWARPKSSSRIEIVAASSTSTFDGFTSRWTIPSGAHARAHRGSAPRPRRRRGRRACPLRSASRIVRPWHVLVGDVDVAAVAAEVVGADAALVTEPRRSLHLPGRARRALALAGDDLERDLEPGALVAREPDRAGPAATERTEGPVAVEDELGCGKGVRGARHGHRLFAAAGDRPSGPRAWRSTRRASPDGSSTRELARRRHPRFRLLRRRRNPRGAQGADRPVRTARPSGGGGGGPRRPQLAGAARG